MADNRFNLDEDALRRHVEQSPGFQQLQDQVNETLRATIREVRDEMTGQPADQVLEALKTRIQERIELPMELDEANLREFAEAIEAGTLED